MAAADYFQEHADATGTALGVARARCFSGLSAYKRLMESGVEAVILETPSYFFPEHAAAAVEAGLHVYMAKPVAADVPGTLKIGALGKTATEKKQVFLVDYQMPTDPINIEVRNRIGAGGLGNLQMVFTVGASGGNAIDDPPLTANMESRLTHLIWVNDDAMGCGYIGNYDIHAVDAVIWALGRRPVAAYAQGGRYRKDPHGDSFDTHFVTYTFADGLVWNHQSARGPTHDWLKLGSLEAWIQGSLASAGFRTGGRPISVADPNTSAADRLPIYMPRRGANIAAFYDDVLHGNCGNEASQRSIDCTLTCILGREAARRGTLLTMDDLVRENKRLEVDLKGLKS